MKYSKLFGKTIKDTPKDATLASHKLLYQAGFIRESTAGRYYFLPLGQRVQDKVISIVRKHMDSKGAQELLMPVMHPLELWQETNRTKTAGYELMTVTDRRGAVFVPGGTAEEMVVDLVRKFQISYKDLPFNLYQFSLKFRDELRARGGLLRVREFIMKDAYSFGTEAQFKKTYQDMWDAYQAICDELHLPVNVVAADNGYIGGEYCHEFVVESEAGESRYFIDEENNYAAHEDVAEAVLDAVNPDEPLEDFKQVNVPAWVQKINNMEKYFKKDKRYMLKSVAYVNREGDIVIVVIRGDLDVNKTKLEQKLDMVGQLESADKEDLDAIGTRTGYVHASGHKFIKPRKAKFAKRNCEVIFVADISLKTVRNAIGGHASFEKGKESEGINVNYGRDFKHEREFDVAMAQAGMISIKGGKLIEKRGVEVGNIFQLGYHYTNLMKDSTYTGESGRPEKYYMGCYGFGIGRAIATIVEKFHDDRGIVWPESVAPFDAHLISLKENETAEEVYKKLIDAGIEVLYDDRDDVSAGAKFADADLIGIPVRLVVSSKTGDQIEWKERTSRETKLLSFEEVLKKLT